MYRKVGSAFLVLLLILLGSNSLWAASSMKIIFNGRDLKTDAAPQIINGRTMVPLRVIADALGAEVSWDDEQKIVFIEKKVDQTADWQFVKVNGEDTTWPYWIRDGKMYLEHRNAIQLVREANRAPLHSVTYFPHSNTLYVDDLAYPLALNNEGKYKIVNIDYFRDLGIVNYNWDAAEENIQLIYR